MGRSTKTPPAALRLLPVAIAALAIVVFAALLWSKPDSAVAASGRADGGEDSPRATAELSAGERDDGEHGGAAKRPALAARGARREALDAAATGAPEQLGVATVAEFESGVALEGATISLLDPLDLEAEPRQFESDAEGRVAIMGTDDEPALVSIEHPSHVAMQLVGERVPSTLDGQTFALVPTGSVVGNVVSRWGGASELIQVGLWRRGDDQRRFGGEPLHQVATDADGTFEFPSVAAGQYALGAWGTSIPLALRGDVVVRSHEQTETSIEVDRGVTIRGRVEFSGSEAPIEGALVRAMPEIMGALDSLEEEGARETRTDANGRYELHGVPSGSLELSAATDSGDFRERRLDVWRSQGLSEQNFSFPEPVKIEGRVTNADGSGAANARVVVVGGTWPRNDAWPGYPELQSDPEFDDEEFDRVEVTCDADGFYTADQLPAGVRLYLAAYPAPDSGLLLPANLRLRNLKAGETRAGTDLQLPEELAVAGRVQDESGIGIEGAEVRIRDRVARVWREMVTVTSGADGAFEIESAAAGSSVSAVLDGYRMSGRSLRIAAGDEDLTITLKRARGVHGVVVDRRGGAVEGARVEFDLGRSDFTLTTDRFGRFERSSVDAGSWEITCSASGYEWRDGPWDMNLPGDSELRIVVDSVPVEGTVTLSGEVITYESRSAVESLRLRGLRGGTVELDGSRFRVTGAQPGDFEIEASGHRGGIDLLSANFDRFQAFAGESYDLGMLELFDGVSVRLTVSLPSSVAMKSIEVVLEPLEHADGGLGDAVSRVELERSWNYEHDGRNWCFYNTMVPRTAWTLVVNAEGCETVRERFDPIQVSGQREIDLELSPDRTPQDDAPE